jgi:hypothetical protein
MAGYELDGGFRIPCRGSNSCLRLPISTRSRARPAPLCNGDWKIFPQRYRIRCVKVTMYHDTITVFVVQYARAM